jgi:hypothetical protein
LFILLSLNICENVDFINDFSGGLYTGFYSYYALFKFNFDTLLKVLFLFSISFLVNGLAVYGLYSLFKYEASVKKNFEPLLF